MAASRPLSSISYRSVWSALDIVLAVVMRALLQAFPGPIYTGTRCCFPLSSVLRCHETPLGYTEIPRSLQQQHHVDDLEHSLQRLSLGNVQPDSVSQPDSSAQSIISFNNGQGSNTENIMDDEARILVSRLKSTLQEYQIRLLSFNALADSLELRPTGIETRNGNESLVLQEQISWFASTISNLRTLPIRVGSSLDKQRNVLLRVLEEKLKDTQLWEEWRYEEQSVYRKVGKNNRTIDAPRYENGEFFEVSFPSSHPLVLLSTLSTLVLSVLTGLPERSSNFLLEMHRDLLKSAFNFGDENRELAQERSFLLKFLPKDIRTARSRFSLEPRIQIFAACPNCSTLYKPMPDLTHDFNAYSSPFCRRTEYGGPECGAALLKWRSSGKLAVRVPIRPFGYYSLHDFVGEMLSRPGMEVLLERYSAEVQPDVLTDIFDGIIIRNFKGVDGTYCFRKKKETTDLFLAWAICVDWFNPYFNKSAGKAVSVGVISLVCLNLPLEVRNEFGNMYVAGIIPGPREPSLHLVNNFLSPVVKDLQQSWENGLTYTRTHKYPKGRKVVSVLVPLVADVPASRKVSGTAGHGAACFCPFCERKKKDICDLTIPSSRRGREEHVRLAKKWRDAQTSGERDALVAENGIRWSVLLELPYWEPHFIVVDTMHNLFLGLARHHFRTVIGINWEKSSGKKDAEKRKKKGITAKTYGKILDILTDSEGPTSKRLRRYSIDELYNFHVIQRISLPSVHGTLRKDDLVSSLLSCELVELKQPNRPSHQVDRLEAEDTRSNSPELDDLQFFNIENVYDEPNGGAGMMAGRRANTSSSKAMPSIGPREIQAIQAAISMTSRPSWQQSPPKGFGTSQQGKLKADQWRTLLEFDLPVALVELWIDSDGWGAGISEEAKEYLTSLVDLTMDLAIAVFWGTSRRTSAKHAARYTLHIRKYLEGLQNLPRRQRMVPNHHYALHVGEQLLLYGPVNSWWAYPYERLIGALQNVSTNHKIGEMELTMLKSHYMAARLRRLFHENDSQTVIRDSISKFGRYFPAHAPGSYSSYVLDSSLNKKDDKTKLLERLDDDIYEAIYSLSNIASRDMLNREFLVHRFHVVNGLRFTSREFERDSIIFFKGVSGRIPGIIHKIFSMPNGKVFFAVHAYVKLSHTVVDPFAQWPDYRASLWSQRVDERVQLVDPDTADICHAARRPWKGEELYVLRAIDRNY